jgi:hypothetical protein
MAKFSDVNTIMGADGGAEAIYRLGAVLITAGWAKVADSDGTTYSSSGVQVTGYGTGANGLNNARAWVVYREPGGRREWLFQRAATTLESQWRIMYSASARFVGGSPSGTQTPSATDEQLVLGAGTHASPTFAALFAVGGGYRYHAIAQSTPVGGCYGFWGFSTISATGVNESAIAQDPLWDASYPAEDTDPCVVGARFASGGAAFGNAGGTHLAERYWNGYGLGGTWRSVFQVTPVLVPVSPYNGKFVKSPFQITESAVGWKGALRYREGCTVTAHAYPDTYDLPTDAKCVVGYSLVPWPDNVAPIL